MAQETPLRFAVMVGSLRRGSFNAAIARALPALAPDGVSIAPLGARLPLSHDVQERLSSAAPQWRVAEADGLSS